MTDEVKSIETEMAEIESQRETLKQKLRSLETRRNEAIARAEIQAMPESKRKAFMQVLGVSGIPSGEQIGIPGKSTRAKQVK